MDFSFPIIFFLSLLFRAVVFIRCYLSIPYKILSVIVEIPLDKQNTITEKWHGCHFKYCINLCCIICCSFKFETCCDIIFWYQNRRKKVNNNDDSLDRLYKWKLVFWPKQKRKLAKQQQNIHFYFIIFWWKKVPA